MQDHTVRVIESGHGPYGHYVTAGRHVLGADAPEKSGGMDIGPDPFQLVLAGLGACTAMTLRMYADRKSIPVKRIDIRLQRVRFADADKEPVSRLERIITFEGNLTDEQRQNILEIADRRPVSRMLRHGVEITSALAS